MLKRLKLTLLILCTGMAATAQTDTTAARDTIPDDLRDGYVDNIPIISLDENDLGDGASQSVSSILTAGRDPFYTAASYNFSPLRFRIRGYDNDHFSTFMNGIPMDNLDNGFTPFGLWGGLNDVMRNRDVFEYGIRQRVTAFVGPPGRVTILPARSDGLPAKPDRPHRFTTVEERRTRREQLLGRRASLLLDL